MEICHTKSVMGTVLATLLLAALLAHIPVFADPAGGGGAASSRAWKFAVYLDDNEIGYHHFYLVESGKTRELRSVASFEYKLLFVPLFRYEHENTETWESGCLQGINSRTDSNGKAYQVDGQRTAAAFRVLANGEETLLPACVMSFAYWDPSFLEQPFLLNSQDGEFLEVEVSEPVFDALVVDGTQRAAWRYRLEAGTLKLDLWYSPEHEWLALKSEVRGGRMLRYVRQEDAV